jgi:putative transposon-encoded protein
MATHRLFIPAIAFLPNLGNSNVYPKPSSIDDANDRFPVEILAFKDSGTRIGASARFAVPKNYVGTPKIQAHWKTTATTGDVVWDVDTKAIADGESLDPSTDDDAQTVTTTAPGTARLRKDSEVTLTGTYAPDDIVQVSVYRDGAQAADTLAAEALLEGISFQYADV